MHLDSLPSHVPQVLINREPLRHLNFDVELLGDCDVIVNELCHHLGGHFSDLCSTPSSAAEITTDDLVLPPASAMVSDGNIWTIPVDSAPVATGSKNTADNVAVVSLPTATGSAPLSGSGSTLSSDLVPAAAGHAVDNVVDISLPVATVSATVSGSSSSAPQIVSENNADDVMVESLAPSVEVRIDTVGSLAAGSETAGNSADVDGTHSENAEHSKNAEHRAGESSKTQAVNWASLLKRMHCRLLYPFFLFFFEMTYFVLNGM